MTRHSLLPSDPIPRLSELSSATGPKPKPERREHVPIALTPGRMKRLADQPGMYPDGASKGLWLRITETRHGQFIHRYQFRSTRREMGLGSTDIVSIEEARLAVLDNRKLMLAGTDRLVQRRERQAETRKASTTFAAVLESYLSVHSAKWTHRLREPPAITYSLRRARLDTLRGVIGACLRNGVCRKPKGSPPQTH